jgi:hydroxymethylpyrimidine/phosphomethylpyrimidine kinase
MNTIPVVMTFGGHDPSGGAGLQADIEALASQGCHATPVITTLTVQDSRNVMEVSPVPASHVIAQARAVLADMPVAAFKIGLLGSTEIAEAVRSILADYANIPLVLDPVLASGAGTQLAGDDLPRAICEHLLPLTTVLTPNSLEARQLAPNADNLDACAIALLEQGAEFVLLTGTHEQTTHVVNTLYQGDSRLESFTWERLPHSYHGSGCTLASSIAAMLAHGLDPFQACSEAQDYTWNALQHGYLPGRGQHLPDRLFWARQDNP